MQEINCTKLPITVSPSFASRVGGQRILVEKICMAKIATEITYKGYKESITKTIEGFSYSTFRLVRLMARQCGCSI